MTILGGGSVHHSKDGLLKIRNDRIVAERQRKQHQKGIASVFLFVVIFIFTDILLVE